MLPFSSVNALPPLARGRQPRQRDVSSSLYPYNHAHLYYLAPQQPVPTLTTEYTPRDRNAPLKSTPQPVASTSASISGVSEQKVEDNVDTKTLPVATAPPSHPAIDPTVTGTLDGRSILEVDLAALADKPWRRPGSDISDWFNYGFDEISWEAYCYRRREVGEVAAMLKANVLVCIHFVYRTQCMSVLLLWLIICAELCRHARRADGGAPA